MPSQSYHRNISIYLSKRSQINRFNKDMELFRRVRKRRLENNNRIVDIRLINFRNDKCYIPLMKLPVSPMVNLNGILPFKTVVSMRCNIPFNPSPLLHSIGYKFKIDRDNKYERFNEPYPMDEILQIMDARSLGTYTRMSGKYKITGDNSDVPTPMTSQPIPPGGSVGKGYGFGMSKKPEPKNKPISLDQYKPYDPGIGSIDNLDDYYKSKEEALSYINDLSNNSYTKRHDNLQTSNNNHSIHNSEDSHAENIPEQQNTDKPNKHIDLNKNIHVQDNESLSRYMDILRDTIPELDGELKEGIDLPYMDDVCNEGDIMRNPRYLGEYRYKYWYHPIYGSPSMPSEAKLVIDKYNIKHPENKIDYESFRCDTIYCHSNGTIVHLEENSLPYDKQNDNITLDGEDSREPRFVIQAHKGFIKNKNLKIGDIFEHVDHKQREECFDNIFFQYKSLRHPIFLPDGTMYN